MKHYKTIQEFYQTTQVSKKLESEMNDKEEKVNLDWTVMNYTNSGNPEVWGPAFWFTLHNSSVRYPVNASHITKERMKGFILGLPVMIPCEICSEHATAHIIGNYDKLDDICSGREKLFKFFVDFHNYVNKRYNKPIMGYKEAYALYTNGARVTKLSYN